MISSQSNCPKHFFFEPEPHEIVVVSDLLALFSSKGCLILLSKTIIMQKKLAKTAGYRAESQHSQSMLTLELFTPDDDERPVYVAGNFNGWVTRDEQYRMEKIRDGHYRYAFRAPIHLSEPMEYKYIKGGWESEELGRDGQSPANRRMEVPRGKVSDVVPQWKQHGTWYDPQFYPDIRVVAKRFNIPQLRRRRRISVLLPWNYKKTDRHYPVLYLQDGQNLFEDDAPYGTWGVDKQLAALAQKGRGDFIVVAIDHGGKERIREFSPYSTPRWGEGLGRDYATFLATSLKPYIDENFRTLPDRLNTGIGGSSMGGLISLYAGLMYPEVFSKYLIFSPSLWVSGRIFAEAAHLPVYPASKVYFYAGGREGSGMTDNATRFREVLTKHGHDTSKLELRVEIDPEGRHNEQRWGREFPKATEWLFVQADAAQGLT
jgi:predicted alpha/beta superfamily hydrolase